MSVAGKMPDGAAKTTITNAPRASGRTLTLGRMLRRSLVHRRARSLSALVALTVSAAVATALLTLYADLDAKLHREFRSFGANVVVASATSAGLAAGLPADAMERVQQAAGPDAIAVPFGYAVATTDRGSAVVVAGTDFAAVRRLDAWWSVTVPDAAGGSSPAAGGSSPAAGGSSPAAGESSPAAGAAWPAAGDTQAALLGERAANFIGDEKAVTLNYAGKAATFHGVGRLRTGGDEDSRVYVPLAALTAWTGVRASVIEVQVPGGAANVEAALGRLRAALPGEKVEPVRQLVEGESRIVDRTHALMYAAVLLIALTVAVSVLATLSASVLERRRDFALMKALGGSQTQLVGLFLLEALLLATGGVAAGFVIGSALALAISEANFGTATLPHISVLPMVVVLNVAIAALAAMIPLRVLRGLQPAALLKGE